jgi:Holliday junction resolvase
MRSIDKGKRGEREVANILKEMGLTARRGCQYSGSPDSPDVVCEQLGDFHLEIKYVEKLNLWDAISQATRDCGDKTPVVVSRKNGKPWVCTLFLQDFLTLAVKAPTSEPS